MISDELKGFIKRENARLNDKFFDGRGDGNERLLAAMVKLSEEVGELSDEALARCRLQRAGKMAKRNDETFAEELSDVLITVLLVAEVAGLDYEPVLRAKIAKINSRSDYGLPA